MAARPIMAATPTISQQSGTVCFSLLLQVAGVQKVEYYIESQLVGAAYASPYTVSVSESNLGAGTHTVTAKVYSNSATAQTTPALFTTSTGAGTPSVSGNTTDTDQAQSGTSASAPSQTAALATPSGLAASASDDGTTAQLSWDAVAGADSYQLWRDGAQVNASTSASFTDTGLTPGQTYDYAVVAIDATGGTSAASQQVAVTMPTPVDTSPVNGNDGIVPPTPPQNNAANQPDQASSGNSNP